MSLVAHSPLFQSSSSMVGSGPQAAAPVQGIDQGVTQTPNSRQRSSPAIHDYARGTKNRIQAGRGKHEYSTYHASC